MAEEVKNRCVIICASPYNQPDFIRDSIGVNDYVICADGGFDTALKAGIKPDIVIGDFDSRAKDSNIENDAQSIVLPTDKDDTDGIYCVKYGISKGFDKFLILGATGGRTDHMYANLFLLKFMYKNRCDGVLEDKFTYIKYTEENLTLSAKGKTVSVLPFGCESAEVTLKGFKYKADRLAMDSSFPIGISNVALSDNAEINVYSGGVLVIVNKSMDL